MTLSLSREIENGYKVKHVPILEVPVDLDYFLLIRDKCSCGSKINLWNTVYMLCDIQLCQKKNPFLFLFTILIVLFQ